MEGRLERVINNSDLLTNCDFSKISQSFIELYFMGLSNLKFVERGKLNFVFRLEYLLCYPLCFAARGAAPPPAAPLIGRRNYVDCAGKGSFPNNSLELS